MRVAFLSDVHANLPALETTTGEATARRVAYDVERAARAIEASALPSEFAGQLREARGYGP